MKKKIIALCLVAAMIIVAAIGTTMAFLTDTDKATNVFAVGDVNINLNEKTAVYDVNDTKNENPLTDKFVQEVDAEGNVEKTTFSKLMPTNKIEKEIVISNLDKDTSAYVRVAIVMNNLKAIQDVFDKDADADGVKDFAVTDVFKNWYLDSSLKATNTVENGTTLLAADTYTRGGDPISATFFGDADNYKIVTNDEVIYVYYMLLEGNKSVTLTQGMNVPAAFDETDLSMYKALSIEVYADAIQQEGFENANAAFDALQAAHPLKSVRTVPPVAEVTKIDAPEEFFNDVLIFGGGNFNAAVLEGAEVVGLNYTATDTPEEAAASEYGNWIADYVVTIDTGFDNEPTATGFADLYLWGFYESFGSTVAIPSTVIEGAIEDNFSARLLGSVNMNFTYVNICESVKSFDCGVIIPDGSSVAPGTKITVELRLFETDETGAETGVYQVVGTYTYVVGATN